MRPLIGIATLALIAAWYRTSPAAAPPAPVGAANLLTLHMTSPTAGWAVGTTGLLRTRDGGVHWQVVTPLPVGRPLRRSAYGLVTSFLDGRHAWVGVDNAFTPTGVGQQGTPPTALRLFRTVDGGGHWQMLPRLRLGTFDYAGKLTFVTPQTGWLEIVRGVAAGSVSFDLYRTLDGGIHWRRALRVGWPQRTFGAPLGCDICTASLTFTGPSTGWLTGCWCGVGSAHSFLYVTRDAARSWRPVSLPLPPRLGTITVGTLPPTFFDARNGILPAVVFGTLPGTGRGETHHFIAYATHDGGRHWTPSAPTPMRSSQSYPSVPYSFPDSRHGVFLDGTQLDRTGDGGGHWSSVRRPVPFKPYDTVQFADALHGWALEPGDPSGRRSDLWRTVNGGTTWTLTSTNLVAGRTRAQPQVMVSPFSSSSGGKSVSSPRHTSFRQAM